MGNGAVQFNPFIGERKTGGVNFYTQKQPEFRHFKAAETGISNINCELQPAYLNTASSGKTYTNGIGESEFGLMRPLLA